MPGIDPDIAALLGGDAGNPVASLADAFRRKRALATIGLATGDPAMAAVGNQLGGEAQHGVQEAIQGKHFDLQQAQLAAMMGHRAVQEEQGQQRINLQAGHLKAINDKLAQQGVRWNPDKAIFENISQYTTPPKRTVLPGATGAAGGAPTVAAPAAPGGAPPASTPAGGVPGVTPAPIGKWQDKALKELGADFNPSSGRAGEFGKNQARINAAKRLLTLAQDEQGNPRDLTPQQMPELAQGLASLISGGGAGAQSQIEHLTPQSLRGDWAKVAQWITNEPHGSGQQAFVKNMTETAQREAQVAQQGIDQTRGSLGAKHQRILRANPDAARNVLKGFGWDIGPDGLPVQKVAPPPPAPPGPPSGGTVKMRAPDGSTHMVPADKVQAATAAGGKLI